MSSLGQFLRGARERREPDRSARSRRRTPGLRREEVAQLAGISFDWYVRLEQGRGSQPSEEVLHGLADALALDEVERRHLFRLAGRPEPLDAPRSQPSRGARAILDAVQVPALVLGPRQDVLATNPAGEALFDGFAPGPYGRNAAWFTVCSPRARDLFVDHAEVVELTAGVVRAAWARCRDAAFDALLDELLARSASFATAWRAQRVAEKMDHLKRMAHPRVGRVDLEVQACTPGDASDQRVLLYTPVDAVSAERLARLERPIAEAG